jgi:hypothetical protein
MPAWTAVSVLLSIPNPVMSPIRCDSDLERALALLDRLEGLAP